MLRLFDRAAPLAAELVKIEPHFAPERAAVRDWLARAHPAAALEPALAVLRKAATEARWREGLKAWNRGADRRLAFLRRLSPDPALVFAARELFAADFGERRFPCGLEATGALFAGPLLLSGARVEGDLRLDGAQGLAPVAAQGLWVAGDLAGDRARFAGTVDFTGLSVGRAARFAGATFAGDAKFDGAAIARELWLRKAHFGGALSLKGARVGRDASLGAVYAGAADFRETHFADTVSFEGAVFNAAAALDGCRFDAVVLTQGAVAAAPASIVGATFRLGVRPSADWLRRGLSVHEMVEAVQRAMAR